MKASAPNNPIVGIAQQFMDARQGDGKRVFAIRDDREGRGRKYYRQLKNGFAGTGLKIFELTDLQSIGGRLTQGFEKSKKNGGTDHSGSLLKEQSLDRALRIIDAVKELAGEESFVLSLQNMSRWDRQTILLVELLLGADGSKPAREKGDGPRGVVLALEDDGIDAGQNAGLDAIIHHPETLRLVQPEDYAPATALRTLDSRSVRPLRLCQLAYLPLTLSELTVLEGTEALTNIRRCGADAVVEGQGKEKVVRLTDGISLFLSDVTTLPPVQLKEYHERLLKIFESRGEGSCVHAACFYHAVKAGNIDAVFRWFESGCNVLLEKGKVDEAASLLKEGLMAASSRQQAFSKEIALRRRLSEIYAMSGQPLQAFQTLCAGDFKGLTVEDWYLVAQTALEAGHLRQAQQAIDGVLNGSCLDEKMLLPFKVLLSEIEYMKGSYEQCLRSCRVLGLGGMLQTKDRLRLLNVEGKVYLATRQFKKAEAVFKENLKLASSSDFRRHGVVSMINIAVARMRLGHYAQARTWLERALKESRRGVFYREEAIALENIAAIYHLERSYQKALTFYHRALEIFKVLDCHELLGRVANNIGELCIHFGDAARAREMLQYSRSRLAEIKGSLVEGVVLLLSGRIEVLDSNYGTAAAEFSRAEEFFRKSGAQHHLAEALVWKAMALARSGAGDRAEACLGASGSLVDESSPLRPMFLLCRARVLKERGGDSIELLEEALKGFVKLGDTEGELECLLEVAQALLAAGDRSGAEKLLRKARSVNELIRCSVPQQHLETYDATPLRRKLLAMKNSINENGSRSGKKSARKHGAAAAGDGNIGSGTAVYGMMDTGAQAGEKTSRLPDEAVCQADLRVLLSEGISLSELKDRIEKRCIEQAMAMAGGNISKAAALLGMKRPRLSQLVKFYKLGKFRKN